MNTTVVKMSENIPQPANEGAALIAMIERVAKDPSIDLDRMERLQAMLERAMQTRRQVAYASALAAMQPELPEIVERGKIGISQGKGYTFARWEDINDAIKPVLGRHGFSLQFKIDNAEKVVEVTCILTHRDGHSEATSMQLPVDLTGSKNPVQAAGSSVSYGKRYTVSALLNLTSRGEDDDARGTVTRQTIGAAQLKEIEDLIEATSTDTDTFCQYYKISIVDELPDNLFDNAKQSLIRKKKAYERNAST